MGLNNKVRCCGSSFQIFGKVKSDIICVAMLQTVQIWSDVQECLGKSGPYWPPIQTLGQGSNAECSSHTSPNLHCFQPLI